MSLRRVLFATDLSAYAGAVVDCLGGLRHFGVREVVLLHVVDQALGYVEGAAGFDLIGQLKADARRGLAEVSGRLEERGFTVRTRLEVGVPAREIARVAEEEDASLIVVGALGRTLLGGALLGSVAERVLHLAQRPVLIERPRVLAELGSAECRRRGEQTFARVLLPTDFSPPSAVAARFVAGLRDAGLQEVVVLHVLEEGGPRGWRRPRSAGRIPRGAEVRLQEMVSALVGQGVRARGRLERGAPADTIIRVAGEENVGSIVMGSRGRGMVAELLLGSVAERVARRSEGPVVIVPARVAWVQNEGNEMRGGEQ